MGGYKRGEYMNGRYRQPHATKAKQIWLTEVYCHTGTEDNIGSCEMRRPWGDNNCHHSQDVGIRCYFWDLWKLRAAFRCASDAWFQLKNCPMDPTLELQQQYDIIALIPITSYFFSLLLTPYFTATIKNDQPLMFFRARARKWFHRCAFQDEDIITNH